MQIDQLRRRSFVVRYLTLFGAEAVSKLCVLVTFAYLARVLGPRDFGIIELALSITVFFVLGTETGLGTYGARIIETSPDRAPQLIPKVVTLRAILGAPAYVLIVSLAIWYRAPGMGILAIYGLMVLLTPFFTQWVFQGLRQMQWIASGSLLRYGVFAALVLLLVRPGSSTKLVAMAEVSGAFAFAIFNNVLLRRVLRIRLDWRGAWHGAIALLRETWFLGASDLTWATMWYAPSIIVGWTDPGRTERVAWLAASVRIVMALHTFVWLYFFNLVPNLAKELKQGVDSWRALVHRSLSTSMWAACFVALAGTLLAPVIVTFVYGQAYQQAVLPFQLAVWMIPVTWLSGHFRFSLIVAGRQDLEFTASAIAGATTALLAYAGAWFYAAPGAAAALLIGGIVNAVVAWMAMRTAIGGVRLSAAAPAVLACLASILLGIASGWLGGQLAGAILACLVYAVVTASQWDLNRLRHAWQGRST
jgi:O-antigen/teichoic acid export membrane protein